MHSRTKRSLLLIAVAASAFDLAVAQNWSDGIETYAAGSAIDGQGGWDGWDGVQTGLSLVSTVQAHGGAQSIETVPGADTIYEFSGIDSGHGTFTAFVYVPSTTTGIFHLLIMDEYNHGGPYEWGAWMRFVVATSVVESDCGTSAATNTPLVFDTWEEVRVELDLDADTVELYYAGNLLCTYLWSFGFNGSQNYLPIALEAIDLYPDPAGSGPFYLDDFQLNWSGDIGTNYCISTVNSTGASAIISATGSESVATNDILLSAAPVPNQPGIFFYGPDQIQVPFGNGFLCIGTGATGIARLAIENASANLITHQLDNTMPPAPSTQITAGSTWHFSCWYRDPAAAGAFFNLSDAVSITFTP